MAEIGARTIKAPVLTGPRASAEGQNTGASIAALGNIFSERAAVLQGQHDLATAQGGITEFRGKTREKMSELLSRKGKDASGSLDEYRQYHEKTTSGYRDGLENGNQKQIFDRFIISRLETDLDGLANHQAREHQNHMISAYGDSVSLSKNEVGLAEVDSIPRALNEALEGLDVALELAFPGTDNEERRNIDAGNMVAAAIENAVGQDPVKAKQYLEVEEYKKYLGPAYTKIRDLVDREAIVATAQKLFPDRYDEQLDLVRKADGISSVSKEGAERMIRGNQNTDRTERERAKQERRTDGFNSFYSALLDRNYGDATKIANAWDVESGDFTEQEKLQAINLTQTGGTLKNNPAAEKALNLNVMAGKYDSAWEIVTDPMAAQLDASGLKRVLKELQTQKDSGFSMSDGISRGLSNISLYYAGVSDQRERAKKISVLQKAFSTNVKAAIAENKNQPLSYDAVIKMAEELVTPTVIEDYYLGIWDKDDVMPADLLIEKEIKDRRDAADALLKKKNEGGS